MSGPEALDAEAFALDTIAMNAMGLCPNDMLATCAYINTFGNDDDVVCRICGDGVIAWMIGGDLTMVRYDWAANTPLYRQYHADGFAAFRRAQSDQPLSIHFHYRHGAERDDDIESLSMEQALSLEHEFVRCPDTVAIFSDGVTQVDGMDWRDVVAELLSFKSTEGDFVKRRMNRFLKDCLKHGKGPIDDISMACIHIDHDKAEEPPEPCTQEARAEGCTCRMESVSSASIDPPEPIVDGWCPVHGGRDPDAERDRQRDDGEV